MNKRLRAKIRIERDIAEKAERRAKKYKDYDDYYKIVTIEHFTNALRKCQSGVRWKKSVQRYNYNAICNIFRDFNIMLTGAPPRATGDREIVIYERGKARVITPIHIRDRVLQKVFCDNSLVPMIRDHLIYDNGASLAGKGVDFTRARLDKHLHNAIREYGPEFYVLSFDFKSYFDSIPHRTCRRILNSIYNDEMVVNVLMAFIKSPYQKKINKIKDKDERERQLDLLEHDELCGICLGSQISQSMALIVPNAIDHYIKDHARFKHYIRYMDDGIVIAKTKEELIKLLEDLKPICDDLGLRFNMKKTHIVKSLHGFTFLKTRYYVTSTGKVIKNLTRKNITRMRRKLRKFRRKVDIGEMTMNNVYDSLQSWKAHADIAMSYHTQRNMMKLYNQLFDGYRLTKKYEHIKGGNHGELFQVDKWAEYRWRCIA